MTKWRGTVKDVHALSFTCDIRFEAKKKIALIESQIQLYAKALVLEQKQI